MNPEPRKPDLFLVGAPKCGTTALHEYLAQHPEIFMSPRKEPQFFAADIFGEQRNVTILEHYLGCFATANGQKRIGEGSTAYLGSQTAAREIKDFSPRAQILIMLRNPADVMHAQHSQRVFDQMEHIRDFERAVDSDEDRTWHYGPFSEQKIIRPTYREVARFAEAVKRYFDAFGRENVHVIIYDDFRLNTTATYAGVLRFLRVSPAGRMEYPIVNANRHLRSARVQQLVHEPPKSIRALSHALLSQRMRSLIGRAVVRINSAHQPRPSMNPRLRARLQMECKPDIQALSGLLNRDLSHWYENRD